MTLSPARRSLVVHGVSAIIGHDAQQVTAAAAGTTPISYQPAYLDPLGRTVRLSLRKLF